MVWYKMSSNLQASQTILHKINLEEAIQQRNTRAVVRSYGAIRIVTHIVQDYVSKKHRSRLQDKNGPIHLAASQIGRVLRVKRLLQPLAFPLQVTTTVPQAKGCSHNACSTVSLQLIAIWDAFYRGAPADIFWHN